MAPRVRVHTLDGSYVQLAQLPAVDVLAIIEGLADDDGGPLLSFDLDDGRSQVHVPRAAVARIDVDWELGPLARLRARLDVLLDGLIR